MIVSTKAIFIRFAVLASVLLLQSNLSSAQTNQCPSCWQPVLRQKIIFNQNIPSSSIRGYVEFLPNGYNPNGTKKYPLLIHMVGISQQGSGNTQEEVCQVACVGATIKIEQNQFPETVVHNGTTYSFIVLSPQYNGGTTGNDLAKFIDYAISRYKVDPSRVYLTGMSAGGSFIMDYMSSSPANAKKVAALVWLAGCNSPNNAGASNTANAPAWYWGIQARDDSRCGSPIYTTVAWADRINQYSPPATPRGTANLTRSLNPQDAHDIFSTVYGSGWKNDYENVFQKHITEWMLQYTTAAQGALPATLGNYDVSLKNKQVVVNFTTNLESNTDYFAIERAGADMQFRQIGKLAAAGNSSTPVKYSFTDPAPLKGTSFYRLVLMNKDGMPDIFEIKKIVNREFGVSFSLSPVPSNKSIQLSFELEESQQLNFAIRDINGRLLKSWSANFSSGNASFPINIEVLTPGVYYLAVQGTRFSETKKFIRE